MFKKIFTRSVALYHKKIFYINSFVKNSYYEKIKRFADNCTSGLYDSYGISIGGLSGSLLLSYVGSFEHYHVAQIFAFSLFGAFFGGISGMFILRVVPLLPIFFGLFLMSCFMKYINK